MLQQLTMNHPTGIQTVIVIATIHTHLFMHRTQILLTRFTPHMKRKVPAPCITTHRITHIVSHALYHTHKNCDTILKCNLKV